MFSKRVAHQKSLKIAENAPPQQLLVFTQKTQRIWNGRRAPVPNPLGFLSEHQQLLRYEYSKLAIFTEALHLLVTQPNN